jgi:hypothetical protein
MSFFWNAFDAVYYRKTNHSRRTPPADRLSAGGMTAATQKVFPSEAIRKST